MKSTGNSILNLGRVVALPLVGLALAVPAIAQDQSDETLEEVVVYAQKRAQDIMVVPVAVTALTGQQLSDSGIKDVFDMQQNVPSLFVDQSQTSTTSSFGIRSISSTSNNFGVESSVGLYVDGVYRSRQSSMINDLVDVETVEVLRGPQGTLFGKNTAAGAISVRSVAPSTDSTDAFFDVTSGNYGLAKFSGAANIPLSDSLAFRGTIFASQRDGYVSDDKLGNDLYNDRDRMGFRAQLGYEPNDDFNMRLIADYSEIDEVCCVALSRVDFLFSRASVAAGAPQIGTDVLMLNLFGTAFTDYPYPQPLLDSLAGLPGRLVTGAGFDAYRTAYDIVPVSQNEDAGLSLELNKTFDNGLTLTSVTALRSFDTFDLIDVDFTDVPLLSRTNDAELKSLSQELRLSGEFGRGNNFVAGLYYFGQEIDQHTTTVAESWETGSLEAALIGQATGLPGDLPGLPFSLYIGNLPPVQTIANGVDLVAANFGALGFQPAGLPAVPGSFSQDFVNQDQSGWAAFAQVEFSLTDSLIATLGARYTDEEKEIAAQYIQNLALDPAARPNFGLIQIQLCSLDPACAATIPPGFPTFDPTSAVSQAAFAPFAVDGWATYLFDPLAPRPPLDAKISDDQVTGNAKLTWLASDTMMFYASYATGFKSGGTNTDRIAPVFEPVFGPETSKSAEIGIKADFGPVNLKVAIYDTQYEDFQANSFTGTGFNLQNAGDLATQGVEIEYLWDVTDTFTVQGFYSRNEGEFESFLNGSCWDAYPTHTGLPDPGLPSDFNPIVSPEVCDRSGGKLPYNPEDRFFLAMTKDFNLGDNILFLRAEYTYGSERFTDGDIDPFTLQDDISLLNLRAGVDILDWNATVTVWGRNVTDERWYHGSFDAPAQTGRMNSYPAEPATYGVTFSKRWD
jgi:outer membrane receptor protein involved in Fe transport